SSDRFRRMKPITARAFGDNMPRPIRVRLQLSPELPDDNPNVFRVAASVPLPYRLREILNCPRAIAMCDQILNHVQFPRSQPFHLGSGPPDLVCVEVD